MLSKTTAIVSNRLDRADKAASALIRITVTKDQNTSNIFTPRNSWQFWYLKKLLWSSLDNAKEPIHYFKNQQKLNEGKE